MFKRIIRNWKGGGDRGFLPVVSRTIILAPLVGVVAGLGAIGFQCACQLVMHYALGAVAGYDQAGPEGEVELFGGGVGQLVPWLLVLVPTIGGLLSGLLVYNLAPEAEGHGTDAAIDAYHNGRGVIRSRVPLVKMVASAITLGTGGSGGREGPIAQIGAGFGSFLGTRLHLRDEERRVLMLAGVGAGIGAIFHAPLAGAIFSIEVLYRDPDFESEALIPAFIATTIAYCVFSVVFGFNTLFHVEPIVFHTPLLLLPLTVLAIVMAAAAGFYVWVFYGIHALFAKMTAVPKSLRPAIGAFATGLLAVGAYYSLRPLGLDVQQAALSVLSFGYGFLQQVLAGDLPTTLGMGAAVTILLVVGFGKILTTSLTISSGGSGGVFGPSMVIGGCLGAVVGLAFNQIMPETVTLANVPIFTLLGMAGFFAAAANTPVSTLIMVSEMTGSYFLLLPSMWVCAVSYLIGRRWQLYQRQVQNRLMSPAHRGDFVIDVLEGLSIRDAMGKMTRQYISATLDMPLRDMARLITHTRQTTFPVTDNDGRYRGLFGINDIRQILYDAQLADLAVAQDLVATDIEPLLLQMDLSTAITHFAEGRYEELPVVDADDPEKVIGLLRRQDIIAAYSSRLMSLRQSDSAPLTGGGLS